MANVRKGDQERATLRQVAELAKVSPMTVSNYVNGRLTNMRPEMQERVRKAVDTLSYRPDASARGLRSAELLSIGMIIVDESPYYLSDGYTNQIVSGLSNFLNGCGYTLQIEGVSASSMKNSSLLKHIRTDGLCVMLSGQRRSKKAQIEILRKCRQPFVVFLDNLSSDASDSCSIVAEDRRGGRLIAKHLLERGVKSSIVLMPSVTYWRSMHARYDGVKEMFREKCFKSVPRLVDCGDGCAEAIYKALHEEFRAMGIPDSIVAVNDQIAIAALNFVKMRGLEIPGRIKIVGFNGFAYRSLSMPLLTSVKSPGYEMGQIGGQEIVKRVREGSFSRRLIRLPVRFLLGETS